HYSRIPHEYWKHRLEMLKALGLNSVATYVFWNHHETEPGVWDFEGDKDLRKYIETAAEVGLNVILRPGPYACGEWEFGGYPWWLQNIEGIDLRRDNAPFLQATKRYIERLYQEVGDLQVTNGGPIIMVQVENEFGSYAAQREDIPMEEHRRFNRLIYAQLVEAGFDAPKFTSDGTWLFEGGSIEGVLPTANGEDNVENLRAKVDQYHDGKGPYMVAEFYTGWLAHWGEPHPDIDASRIARKTDEYLRGNVSFNYYMVHGGTNFAFTSGANYDKRNDIQPDLTSYDYNAPISEAGWATAKYDSLRSVIQQYSAEPLPPVPAAIPVVEIPEIAFTLSADVISILKSVKPVYSESPMTFEELGQGYGYVLYSRKFNQPIKGTLEIEGLRDYATVYVNGERKGVLNRRDKEYSMEIDIPFNSTLDILVENMGRINYGPQINFNTKGIISPVVIGGNEISGSWEMYGLPLGEMPDAASIKKSNLYTGAKMSSLTGSPAYYFGTFHLEETGDTFLDMEPWGKGIVFVNGHNLGRYWEIGPQQTLYVPGVWLREGENTIVVFEQLNDNINRSLRTVTEPVLTDLKD
ncbi:MAG: beta-galactosidase, partial [Alistipes sp.]|nr:beta-galactosidase [Alistipes sp.]